MATFSTPSDETIIQKATEVFDIEIDGLRTLKNSLGADFIACIRRCLEIISNGGKLVLTGVGKSGHISKKIAATLASTGSRAVFMHPVEAMHGDLGIVSPQDIVLAVSYSGETDELLAVLPAIKRMGVEIIAICGKADCRLGQVADLVVPMHVPREACPFNMAPTTTTTALACLGDAMAMTMLHCRHFGLNDYAKLHPAGAIGRSITLKIKDFMRTGERAARVLPDTKVRDALLAMTAARSGAVAIVNDDDTLAGIFTDGDFRRQITDNDKLLEEQIKNVMTQNPITMNENAMAVEIMKILEKRKIDDILVTDDQGHFTGLVDIQDLPKFKVM